jgi:hypothetical protein
MVETSEFDELHWKPLRPVIALDELSVDLRSIATATANTAYVTNKISLADVEEIVSRQILGLTWL